MISVAVLALVGVIVLAASLVARHTDTHIAVPGPEAQPMLTTPPVTDRIPFTASRGTGELVLLERTWVTTGDPSPTSGHYLLVRLELTCTTGEVDVNPYLFQVFDGEGTLFDIAPAGPSDAELEIRRIGPGERLRGTIVFDLPRGEATLMMSDASERPVTALRIAG